MISLQIWIMDRCQCCYTSFVVGEIINPRTPDKDCSASSCATLERLLNASVLEDASEGIDLLVHFLERSCVTKHMMIRISN